MIYCFNCEKRADKCNCGYIDKEMQPFLAKEIEIRFEQLLTKLSSPDNLEEIKEEE